MSDIDKTLADRGAQYGEFSENSFIMQELKNTMRATANWPHLKSDQKEALDMVAHKVGRILGGNPDHIDSWHDIVGYARLVEKRLTEEAKFVANAQSTMEWPDLQTGDNTMSDTGAGVKAESNGQTGVKEDTCGCPGCTLRRLVAEARNKMPAGTVLEIFRTRPR